MTQVRHRASTPMLPIRDRNLTPNPECRKVLRPRFTAIIQAGNRHVCTTQPFRHRGNVGFMRKSVRGGRRRQ